MIRSDKLDTFVLNGQKSIRYGHHNFGGTKCLDEFGGGPGAAPGAAPAHLGNFG